MRHIEVTLLIQVPDGPTPDAVADRCASVLGLVYGFHDRVRVTSFEELDPDDYADETCPATERNS